MARDPWKKFKDEILANPETRAAFDARKPAYDLASRLIEMRKALDLTQRDLARAAGMTQPEIARIESGEVSPRWDTVSRIFSAVGAQVAVKVRIPGGGYVNV